MRKSPIIAAVLGLPLAVAACSSPAPETDQAATNVSQDSGDMTPDTVDIIEAASATGNLDQFAQAALQAGIAEDLATRQNITVLAPIDQAFEAVDGLDALMADRGRLTRVLQLHVIPNEYMSSAIPQGETQVETLSGETLTIRNDNGQIRIIDPAGNEAMVVQADIDGDNGVVHAINTVLMP